MIQFNVDNTNDHVQACIRWENLFPNGDPYGDRQAHMMDLAAADGANGNLPIDWPRLLAADDFNFIHDVGGIHQWLNRQTGELDGGFVPRHTLPEAD